MLCRRDRPGDPLLSALAQKGINLILPPRIDISPGDLMLADGDDSIRRGDWTQVFGLTPTTAAVPAGAFSSFTFNAASQLDVSLAAKLMGRILSAMGIEGGKLGGALSASADRTVELSLIAPASKGLEQTLDHVLAQLRDGKASIAAAYNDRRFFIVTTAWRAKGLRLQVTNSSGKAAELDADVANEISASGSLTMKREDSGTYAFVAPEPLIFGIALREIVHETGVLKDKPTTVHFHARGVEAGAAGDDAHDFVGDDAFVKFSDG